ncbi:MAG TPA: radical SAM protein [bacterium (Candidatus Stahlbacteria)]|nr:radical SAM protein [Candidatus Stahlbacteria bacterium]
MSDKILTKSFTDMKESPGYVRMSLAAAITLGLRDGLFYRSAKLQCINILMTYKEGCSANCAYCGLARKRVGEFEGKSFIRVEWPIYELEEIITRMEEHQDRIKRICVSMITNPRAVQDLTKIIKIIRNSIDTPISLLVTPTLLKEDDFIKFKQLGADRIGIAVDAATPELFDKHRGRWVNGPHKWSTYWNMLKIAVKIFGESMVGCHLIVGLGETEKEMLSTIQKVYDLGARTHLFSFFPEIDSILAKQPQPPVGSYRRIQLGRFLIDEGIAKFDNFAFNSVGQLVDFGTPEEELTKVIDSGIPFMTSGCPDATGKVVCTRPYGDSEPGPDIRSYPFVPEEEDIVQIKKQLWSY